MKGIYLYNKDFGRMGDIDGVFIANKIDVENAIGKTAEFGEALGKHSDISVDIDESDIILKTDDQDFIEKFESIMGDGTISGYNPLDYIYN